MGTIKILVSKYLSLAIILLYLTFIVNASIGFFAPNFYKTYVHDIGITSIYNTLGGFVFFGILCYIILHITRILKIEKKYFWLMVSLLLFNLMLLFLEVLKQGDS